MNSFNAGLYINMYNINCKISATKKKCFVKNLLKLVNLFLIPLSQIFYIFAI